MAAVVAAVAAYFASLPQPTSGKYPTSSTYKSLIDIRLYIKDIPESVLKYCPKDLRKYHLEHMWIPFCREEFLTGLLNYKQGQITEEKLAQLVE